MTDGSRRRAGLAIAAVAALAIALATLIPSSLPTGPARRGDEWCLICGELGGVDAVLNTLLFIPLGLGLALAGIRFGRAMPAMCAATLSIEFLQLAFIPGRDASLGDLLTNATGAAVGWLIGTQLDLFLRPTPRAAVRLAALWLVAWIALQGVGAFALRPNPILSLYFGQLTPDVDPWPPFAGNVMAPTLDGQPILDGPFDDSRGARDALARDDGAELAVGVVSRWQPVRRAAIVRIADHERREILRLGADGSRLVFGVRTGASVLRLRPVTLSVDDVFRVDSIGAGADTAYVRAQYGSETVAIAVDDGRTNRALVAHVTTAKAWRVFFPATVYIDGSAWRSLLDALWVFTLLVPAGYWAAVAARGALATRHAAGVAAAVAVALSAGLAIGPLFFGLARPMLIETLAAVAGVSVGASLVYLARLPAWGRPNSQPGLTP